MILGVQLAVLLALSSAVFLLARSWPYPSPLIRDLLPAKKRWPETQIRGWLKNGKFHPGYLNFFYRDPERVPPSGDSIIAPADGLLTSFEVCDGVRYIVIALSFWDMHTQRSPLAGDVVSVETLGDVHMDGEGRNFAFLRDKTCPVQTRVVIDTRVGQLAVRLITSIAARRIETWVAPGDRVERGQRIGRILLGSTVVLELPEDVQVDLALGVHLRAGESEIGPEKAANSR